MPPILLIGVPRQYRPGSIRVVFVSSFRAHPHHRRFGRSSIGVSCRGSIENSALEKEVAVADNNMIEYIVSVCELAEVMWRSLFIVWVSLKRL